nr:type I Zorya anti-phage system protein ZorC [uncultured Enterobacter sp.]
MSQALNRLSQRIANTLGTRSANEHGLRSDFVKLEQASLAMEAQFEKAEKIPAPPQEKRLDALRRFRLAKTLSARDWRLVFYGLTDSDPQAPNRPILLEDSENFPRVDQQIKEMIARKTLKRRFWAALCSSYFAYQHDLPQDNPHWCVLRTHLIAGYQVVKATMRREKAWMKTLDLYHDIFTSRAGTRIAQQLLEGEKNSLSTLEKIAQIPDSSWLWKRIFGVILARINDLDDETFIGKISWLLELAKQWPRFRNTILSTALTRYYHSPFSAQPHGELKQAALEYWDSPQLKSQKNKWHQYVDESVASMVRSWLATQDLTHFFELLRGNGDVDQARLHYWLRFANQMGFTRIVMGYDAAHDRGSDFVKFRDENKGRLSHLRGGRTFDNAMVMQINDYLFVEFSGTGNAMYAYRMGQAPFNPENQVLDINLHLKDKFRHVIRLPHTPRAEGYSKTRISGWMHKYDDELAKLGIRYLPEQQATPSKKTDRDTAIQQVISSLPCTVVDNRQRGGALSVVLDHADPSAVASLLKLGFTPVNKEPRRFWIK